VTSEWPHKFRWGARPSISRSCRSAIVAALVIVVSGAAAGALGTRTTSAAVPTAAPSGSVVDLLHNSAGMTMVADLEGVLHAAALVMVDTSGTWSAVYARCTADCALAASWSAVGVAEAGVGHVPTIALTDDGRPRIAYYVSTGPSPGLHYAECDSDCLTASNWHDVWLSEALSTNPAPRPRLPFTVSPAGGAAYAFDDATGLQLLWCPATCAASAAWTSTQIGGPFIVPESLAFGPDESLQLVARVGQRDTESLLFLECLANCSSVASWHGVTGLWQATGQMLAQLARTGSGGSRIAVYADDPSTLTTERVFSYLACDAACATPSSWLPPLLLPIAADSAPVGFALVLDAADNPLLAFAGDTASAVSRCTTECTTPAGRWDTQPRLSAQDLDAGFPITPPPSCEWAGWSFYTGPALTLFDGRPAIGLTASAKAYGGQCAAPPADAETVLDTVSFVTFGT
jgi:hypothetical protein